MKKQKNMMKTLVFSIALALGTLAPTAMNAQNDDFFRAPDDYNTNRDILGFVIVNNGIGQQETPLNSGLLILTVIGAGYAVTKRKK